MSGVVVSALHVYPIKSARGVSLPAAQVGSRGFLLDRRYVVVDASGSFVSQRSKPAMATVEVSLRGRGLEIRAGERGPLFVASDAPGVPRAVQVWNDAVDAERMSAEADALLSDHLGEPVELVRFSDRGLRRVPSNHRRDGYAGDVAFADAFPFLIVSEASLAELNRRLADPVPMDRFRPNIVLSGCGPFEEDGWEEIAIGAVRFSLPKACSRCVTVDVDQKTGTKGKEPLATLARFRTRDGKVLFGQNALHRGEGEIRIGDRVTVARLGAGANA